MKPAYKVEIIESERGWGQKVDDVEYFRGKTAKKNAEDFVKKFNSQNNLPSAPDIYWYATTPKFVDEDEE